MNVNIWEVTDQIQELIRSGARIDRDRLADADVPLNESVSQEAGSAESG
jgi:3-phenylpropionate/trans-cinnamate dioxygenase ferredoxin reductase subunit